MKAPFGEVGTLPTGDWTPTEPKKASLGWRIFKYWIYFSIASAVIRKIILPLLIELGV
jgi:hypothetical protein